MSFPEAEEFRAFMDCVVREGGHELYSDLQRVVGFKGLFAHGTGAFNSVSMADRVDYLARLTKVFPLETLRRVYVSYRGTADMDGSAQKADRFFSLAIQATLEHLLRQGSRSPLEQLAEQAE